MSHNIEWSETKKGGTVLTAETPKAEEEESLSVDDNRDDLRLAPSNDDRDDLILEPSFALVFLFACEVLEDSVSARFEAKSRCSAASAALCLLSTEGGIVLAAEDEYLDDSGVPSDVEDADDAKSTSCSCISASVATTCSSYVQEDDAVAEVSSR